MLPTEANNPNAPVTLSERFTIYSPLHRVFASRYGPDAIRINKRPADEFCYMTLIEYVEGTNKIRFNLDNGAVVFRHSQNGNLHSEHTTATHPSQLFELIPRPDGTFTIKADDGLYVSAYDAHYAGGFILRSSKRQPDEHCIFEIRNVIKSGSIDDIKKVSNENEAEDKIAMAFNKIFPFFLIHVFALVAISQDADAATIPSWRTCSDNMSKTKTCCSRAGDDWNGGSCSRDHIGKYKAFLMSCPDLNDQYCCWY
ncbi:hypothetical protein BGZ52_006839 [Haplosporangium bisporale]|nr:hypothetical protein BGZ52_006839 [Haplosporangium bisporale]